MFVQDDQEPIFGSKKTHSKALSMLYILGSITIPYVKLIEPKAGEKTEIFRFVLKRSRGAKYIVAHDLDLRHAQRYFIHA